MYRWFSCRWLDAGRLEKADDPKWVAHLSLIHCWPIALGATARPTKPASRSTVAGGRELSSNPSSVIGRRGRPPQVGVRHRPGASISEAAWLPVERDPSVTTEAAELWSHAGSSTAVLNASAVTAPTPCTVIRRRHTWSCLAAASPSLCSDASWLMTAARVCDHASSPLRVRERTRFAGGA